MPNFHEISKQLIGQPYELGKCDCLTMVLDYLRLLGVDIAQNESFNGINLQNYADLYRRNNGTIDSAADWLATKLREIKPHESLPGDVLFLEEDGSRFIGIDGGNGKIIAAVIGKTVGVMRSESCKRLRAFRHG